MTTPASWTCSCCGKIHQDLMEGYTFAAPWAVMRLPQVEFAHRVVMREQFCVFDRREFSVQGVIEIPVRGRTTPFLWVAWAALDHKDFARAMHLAPHPQRTNEPPYPGRLVSKLPLYADTMGLELQIRTPPAGRKHMFILQAADHELVAEQRDGISLERLGEMSERLAHHWRHPLAGEP